MSSRYAAMARIAACIIALGPIVAPGVLKADPGPAVVGQATFVARGGDSAA